MEGLEPTTYGLTVRRSTNWTTSQVCSIPKLLQCPSVSITAAVKKVLACSVNLEYPFTSVLLRGLSLTVVSSPRSPVLWRVCHLTLMGVRRPTAVRICCLVFADYVLDSAFSASGRDLTHNLQTLCLSCRASNYSATAVLLIRTGGTCTRISSHHHCERPSWTELISAICGVYGTRTRDLRRDRAAF